MNMTVQDLRPAIIPRSDQLNSEQLIAGPMTVRVAEVQVGSAEQPVVVHYENENGRPYKPCKTMLRVLILAWGPDGTQWAGQSMTLYSDPKVRFGGDEVGGIRISHLTGIPPKGIDVKLTATRGKKVLHHIDLLTVEGDAPPTLAQVLAIIPKIKGQKGRTAAEAMIEQLPFEDQLTATEALDARVASLQTGGA